MMHRQKAKAQLRMRTSLRTKIVTPIALAVLMGMPLVNSCKFLAPAQSSVKDINISCVGSWLSAFIAAIPLPGFEELGAVASAGAKAIGGQLKGAGTSAANGLCSTAASFSGKQMEQMKQAIKDGFSDQNHLEAITLMNKVETKFSEFIPDQDRFTSYTITNLQSIIDDVNVWWSNYDQSGTRIYNVQDFVIVTGYTMKAYQHQVREVALEAAQTKSAGDAQKVRDYAGLLSDKADHVRKELDDIAANDVAAVAKTFWKNSGTKQTKTYYASELGNVHCYESAEGKPYVPGVNESTDQRVPRFLAGMRATTSLDDLSNYVRKNATICCSDNDKCTGPTAIEPIIAQYIDETAKQVKVVMFDNNADIMKYHDETLPIFINASQTIKAASDNDIFTLAVGSVSTSEGGATSQGSTGDSGGSGSSGGGCPDGDNGAGKGFGSIYQCGANQCAKSDKSYATECVIGGGSSSDTGSGSGSGSGCPDGDNGSGKGYGAIYQCGANQCAKSDKSYATECIIGGSSSTGSSSTGSSGGGGCPDGDNGTGKGFGTIYQCGNNKCAKTDKSYATECTVGG